MKVSFDRSEAYEAVRKCLNVAGKGTTLPILSCLLIRAAEGELRFSSSDLDRMMEVKIPADISKPGTVAFNAKLLAGILRTGTTAEMEVSAGNKVVIRCGGSVFRYPGMPAAEWPEDPRIDLGGRVELSSTDWLEASQATSWAAGNDATRPSMMGTLLTTKDRRLSMVATDGRRLSTSVRECSGLDRDLIIPTSTMAAIDVIAANGGTLALSTDKHGTYIIATCGGDTLTSKVIGLNFPNYQQVYPRRGNKVTRITLRPDLFLAAIERAMLMVTPAQPSMTLDVQPGKIVCIGGRGDSEATAEVEVEVDGPPVRIAFNPGFLTDPLRRWEIDDTAELELEEDLGPGLLRAGGHEYIIMPMRVAV